MDKQLLPRAKAEEQRLVQEVMRQRQTAEQKFPLVFGLFATFGLVATLYGFEKLIDRSQLLSSNPWILLVIGVSTLLLTGAAYRKLN